MGPIFAIPLSMKPISLDTKVAVALFDEPVSWNEGAPEVHIVFLLAVRAGMSMSPRGAIQPGWNVSFVQVARETL